MTSVIESAMLSENIIACIEALGSTRNYRIA